MEPMATPGTSEESLGSAMMGDHLWMLMDSWKMILLLNIP
jgi:hypothetical protein